MEKGRSVLTARFYAERGIPMASRLSVCLSACLSLTLVDCDHTGWNSSKIIISRLDRAAVGMGIPMGMGVVWVWGL